MGEFFKWVASLKPEYAWGLFLLLCLFMLILPFAALIKKWFWIIFSGEPTEIRDFSYRIIPERYAGEYGMSMFYVTNSEKPVYFKGMRMLICWDTRGAIRTDLYKLAGSHGNQWELLHKNLKGNIKVILLDEGINSYKLVITSPKIKKIEQVLVLEVGQIKKLDTFNLSGDDFFGQRTYDLHTARLSEATYTGKRFSLLGINKLLTWNFNRFYTSNKRSYARTLRLFYLSPSTPHKEKIRKTITAQKIVQSYRFNPAAYNQAVDEHNSKNTN
jgi:hypothetical protein